MCLSQGRYILRYGTVLGSLEGNYRNVPKANGVYDQLYMKLNPPPQKKKSEIKSLIGQAKDWEMTSNLHRKLIIPKMLNTTLRPAIVICSE